MQTNLSALPGTSTAVVGSIPPLWNVLAKKNPGDSKDEAYLKWMRDAYDSVAQINQPIAQVQLSNQFLFQGLQTHLGMDAQGHHFGDESEHFVDPTRVNELTINELFDTVMQLSNSLSKFNITTIAIPHANESSDREAARVVKEIMETTKYVNNMVQIYRDMIKESIIMGESYLFLLWDRYKGDVHPAWLENNRKQNPEKIITVNGRKVEFNSKKAIRLGDIKYLRRLPWEKGLDPQRSPEEVQWCMTWSFEPIVEVEFDHPKVKGKIKPSKKAAVFDINTLYTQELEDHVLVIEVYGRSSRFMEAGFYMKATPEVVLESPGDNPYPRLESSRWGNLPLERITDIDLTGSLTPMSTFQILAPLQRKINQFYTQAAENLLLGAHLKMLRPKQGKIKTSSFANGPSYIDYVAPFEPKMLAMATIPPELFAMIELMQKKISQLQGIQPVTKGQTGSEVRSAKQIDALRDIEAVRGGDRIQKKNDLVAAVDRKSLAMFGRYYKEDDGRLLHIVGTDKKAFIKSFDVSVLSKPYDVRLRTVDGFPEDPSARLRAVSQLMQNPAVAELYSKEQWAAILEPAMPDKFFDDTKTAVMKAEWENQQFEEGANPPDPLEADDHIVHWRVIMSLVRSQNFLELPKSSQQHATDHLMMHEELMDSQMKKGSPVYLQQLSLLSGFPSVFQAVPPPPPPMPVGPDGQPLPAQQQ